MPSADDGQGVAQAEAARRALVVVVRELVELVFGQKVVVQDCAGEGGVGGPGRDGEEGGESGG